MNESQSGFRSQRSTSMTIIDATEELSNALENKKPLEYSLMWKKPLTISVLQYYSRSEKDMGYEGRLETGSKAT